MIPDGCLMLEILRTATQEEDDYEPDDPIFHTRRMLYIMPYIWPDMLMLENQLRVLVLDWLVAVEDDGKKYILLMTNGPHRGSIKSNAPILSDAWFKINREFDYYYRKFLLYYRYDNNLTFKRSDFAPTTQDDVYISKLILNYCSASKDTANKGKCLNVLDVVRKSLLLREKPKLDKHGIWFKKSKTGSLTDISFAGGVLSLPEIVVEEATESMFLSLIAFERFHVRTRNEVTSNIYFMDYIIDNECDVALLYNLGIVLTVLGDDKETMELFHLLAKYTTIEPNNSLIAVCNKVNEYCNKPWNKWRSNFIETYFRGPWALWSFMAAIFLCALAIIQTIYLVLRTHSLPLYFFIFVQSCEG
ncbi:putative UPF0481 protein At3g02645 [Eucalyptus grandis]|uniref:putative UPF0481 protein At3g02645 n=1 Tax=Eucalyptus grandis TaxID=71139 RepID=UPI00192EA3C9|nr:putative UPF0481 protein At3g02645 [Eucalyptus grandis]